MKIVKREANIFKLLFLSYYIHIISYYIRVLQRVCEREREKEIERSRKKRGRWMKNQKPSR